jgi:hypothetical protein
VPHAESLLRLYPPAWRRRYGEEFLDTVGPESLRLQQVIDIVSGAIDAWLSADVRRGTRVVRVAPSGGGPMRPASLMSCERRNARYSARDGLIGGGVMIGATVILLVLGIAAGRNGWPVTGEILKGIAYPASLMVSMPFWLMKGQPWRAQAVILGVTVAFLVVIGYIATRI